MRLAYPSVVLLSLGVAAYALVLYGFFPPGMALHPDMRANFEAQRIGLYLHVFGASCALLFGPWQFSRRLRAARPAVHRWLGRAYLLLGVGVGGMSGLYMAFHAFGGLPARLGFGVLALCWLASGWLAYRAIRRGDVALHRRWMLINFALSFAAVTLRLELPLLMLAGLPFVIAYPLVSWLCWLPNLWFGWRLGRMPAGTQSMPARSRA